MNKPWHEMTPEERLAARIAKNREIDQRVADRGPAVKKARPAGASKAAGQGAGSSNILEKFQEIKRTQGIDAASEFLETRRKS